MSQRIYLRKTEKEELEKNPKLPYFRLVLIEQEDENAEAEWTDIGAFWKAKSGNGYSGRLNDEASVVIDESKAYKGDGKKRKPRKKDEEKDGDTSQVD